MTASHTRRACDNGGACFCIEHPEEVARINAPAPSAATSEWVGRRCRMRYGLGTIDTDWSDKGLFGVVADVGGWWLCDEAEVCCPECDEALYMGHDPECSGGNDAAS